MVVRGLEAHPVILGDLVLPDAARLKVARIDGYNIASQELVTLAESNGTSGALLRVQLDAKGPSFLYLEACLRLIVDERSDDDPIFLSSGAEDYFLSASYFDEGMFKTPEAGVTFFDRHGTVGAYKTHDRDSVVWQNRMKLVFRNCETTSGCGDLEHCPNQFCNGTTRAAWKKSQQQQQQQPRRRRLAAAANDDAAVVYSTLVWYYEWPTAATVDGAQSSDALRAAASEGECFKNTVTFHFMQTLLTI